MRCLYCGQTGQGVGKNSLFTTCPWCDNPLPHSYTEVRMLAQCSDCGKLLSGPFAGLIFPDLRVGVSHGLCPSCAEQKLTQWRKQKQLRSSARIVSR